MSAHASPAVEQTKIKVRRDLRAVRKVLKQIKKGVQLVDLSRCGHSKRADMINPLDRRLDDRTPVEMPIYVLPATFDGRHVQLFEDGATEIIAVTRDISLRGVGFLHDEPFEASCAVVTFDLLDGSLTSLLLDVRWSNMAKGDMYMSGGRFIGIASPDASY